MQEQIIIEILKQLSIIDPEINQQETRQALRFILSDYDITPKEKALALNGNMDRFIRLYLATRKLDGIAESTLYNYRLQLNHFRDYVPMNIEDVTTMDIRKFLVQYAADRGLKRTSLEALQSSLKAFFSWLEIEDHISKSPARKLKPMKTEKRTRKSLTAEQLENLRIDGCRNERDRAILEMLFSTGGRVSELCQININDINWSENSVSIIGKGNKERTIYFSDKAKAHLKKYLNTRKHIDNDALFIGKIKPYNRLSTRSIQQIINTIGKNAGFETSVFPHLLRHTMATLGYRSGISLPIIQELLGHSSPVTTQIYAELDKGVIREAHRKHLGI